MDGLNSNSFSDALFAMYELRMGKGEDTVLSRRVGINGTMVMVFGLNIKHPDDDEPRAYPTQPFQFGYALAYSRRLINDCYRAPDQPKIQDRVELVKSYIGTAVLAWSGATANPRRHRFAYAAGYTLGALRGLIHKPTARNLTPKIDWRADAERALAEARAITSPAATAFEIDGIPV
jgi:hypothetical protein